MQNDVHADRRRSRSDATKEAMMLAAERLIAERGVEKTTIREIVSAAGQKNESALQYHFETLDGLIRAIHEHRAMQIREARSTALQATLEQTPEPTLRQLCSLMATPIFELASTDGGVRNYVKAFGNQRTAAEQSPLRKVSRAGGGGKGGRELGRLLRKSLPHLDDEDYRRRMDTAVILCSACMYHQAHQHNAFRGKAGTVFLNHLIDALVGLLDAKVSAETQALKHASKR